METHYEYAKKRIRPFMAEAKTACDAGVHPFDTKGWLENAILQEYLRRQMVFPNRITQP